MSGNPWNSETGLIDIILMDPVPKRDERPSLYSKKGSISTQHGLPGDKH